MACQINRMGHGFGFRYGLILAGAALVMAGLPAEGQGVRAQTPRTNTTKSLGSGRGVLPINRQISRLSPVTGRDIRNVGPPNGRNIHINNAAERSIYSAEDLRTHVQADPVDIGSVSDHFSGGSGLGVRLEHESGGTRLSVNLNTGAVVHLPSCDRHGSGNCQRINPIYWRYPYGYGYGRGSYVSVVGDSSGYGGNVGVGTPVRGGGALGGGVTQEQLDEIAALPGNERAYRLMMLGMVKDAVAVLREYLRQSPEDMKAMRMLGLGLVQQGRLDEAVATLSLAYYTEPGLAGQVVEPIELGLTTRGVRQGLRKAVGHANKVQTGSAWLLVGVLMQVEGREGVARRMIQRAAERGLESSVADAMLAEL